MQTHYVVDDAVIAVRVEQGQEAGRFVVTVGDTRHEVEAVQADVDGRLILRIDGRRVRAFTARDGDRRLVRIPPGPAVEFEVGESASASSRHRRPADDVLAAAMHSQVVEIAVAVGDAVARGDTLVVLEAMKMETRVVAPYAGVVRGIHCSVGEVVEPGRALVELEAGNAPE